MIAAIPEPFGAYGARSPEWARWLESLPRLMAAVAADWSLRVDGPGAYGETSLVVPVVTPQGRPAVAKFSFPHAESEFEALALRHWAGQGVVELIRADPRRWVLLAERADGDRDLHTVPVRQACEIIAGFYGSLHRPPPPQLARLSTLVGDWADRLALIDDRGRVPRRFHSQAVSLARDFAADPATDTALLHTDLHYGNVLAARRLPWLVIDPKPIAGDPAYEVAPLLWNRWDEVRAAASARAAILERFDVVVDRAGLDADRARSWVIVRELVNILWALEDADRGRPLDAEWITRATTIVKAIQP